jgi:hypothetical protein
VHEATKGTARYLSDCGCTLTARLSARGSRLPAATLGAEAHPDEVFIRGRRDIEEYSRPLPPTPAPTPPPSPPLASFTEKNRRRGSRFARRAEANHSAASNVALTTPRATRCASLAYIHIYNG